MICSPPRDREMQMQAEESKQANTHGKRGRFSTNVIGNLANFAFNVAIGLWFTPYLIANLGIAAYGLIPLAITVSTYFSVVTFAMNSAVGRHITYTLEQGDREYANRIFSTSLVSTLVLVIALIGPGIWLFTHVGSVVRVPAGCESQAVLLFACTIAMFFLSTIETPIQVSSFCRNRLDLRSAVGMGGLAVRVATVVVLFHFLSPKIWHVGLGLLAGGVISFIGSIIVWRALTPELRIRLHKFDWKAFRELTTTGGWLVVNQIGTLLYLGIDLLVINRLLGTESGGRYAAVMQWSSMLRGMAGAVAGVFGPTVVFFYAQKNLDGLVHYARQAVKFQGVIMALATGLICGLSRPLLMVWLGPKFVPLAPLMSLMTAHLCVNLGLMPLLYIEFAANKMTWPGIITCGMGLVNLGLALFLAGPAGWGMYGVAVAGAIMLTAKNAIFTPIYASRILGKGNGAFLRELVSITALATLTGGLSWWASIIWDLTSWSKLATTGIGVAAIFAVVVFAAVLSPEEKGLVLSKAPLRRSAGLCAKWLTQAVLRCGLYH